jgi:hypothetical protein
LRCRQRRRRRRRTDCTLCDEWSCLYVRKFLVVFHASTQWRDRLEQRHSGNNLYLFQTTRDHGFHVVIGENR